MTGNLTTEIINISISLVEELNALMMSEGFPVNQSELQVNSRLNQKHKCDLPISVMKRLYQSLCNQENILNCSFL